ncbi:MAG TPA: hypothetical protein VIN59_00330 [Alphaproteobacteria bacterium]
MANNNYNNRNWTPQAEPANTAPMFRTDAANNTWGAAPMINDMEELRAKIAAMPYNNPHFWSMKR